MKVYVKVVLLVINNANFQEGIVVIVVVVVVSVFVGLISTDGSISTLNYQQGIVIVDSPGFGNSTMMDDAVKSYLTEASAFIYVINTPNAGGVQKDRVGAN